MVRMTAQRDMLLFDELIRDFTGTTVLPTECLKGDARELLNGLKDVAENAMRAMMDRPIYAMTPNRAGMEAKKRVGDAFSSDVWFGKVQPIKRQGYPDFSIATSAGTKAYVECKTFGSGKEEDTFRSLYLSRSICETVMADAYHIAIGIELRRVDAESTEASFVPDRYKIVDLHGVTLAMKEEWHARNCDLYSHDRVLVAG